MKIEDIKTICVVGGGTMGRRIALQCAAHGFKVNQWSRTMVTLTRAREWQRDTLKVERGTLSEEAVEKILSRISYTTDLKEAAGNADFVFEAVPEKLELKRKVFGQLDDICPSHTILATNSSSIKSSLISDATNRADKVLDMHFGLVVEDGRQLEIMGNRWTSEETIELATALGHAIDMTVIRVRKEAIGFIYNRIWRAIKKAALNMVEMGVATVEDVDRAWMAARPGAEGPFIRMDKIGLDVVLAIERQWYQESGDPRDKPPEFLVEKVRKGELGVKTGKGFYTYPHPAYEEPGWLKYGSEKCALEIQ